MDQPSSPLQSRPSSPSPNVTPTPAISACPPLDRSVSMTSAASSFSGSSSSSGTPEPASLPRRRGYVRPQATSFADSALNRESVMNLGTIAHLQYYFARTGLLDGKGGQLAKSRQTERSASANNASGYTTLRKASDPYLSPFVTSTDKDSTYSSMRSSPEVLLPFEDSYIGDNLVESPTGNSDEGMGSWEERAPTMLPPTVSTYNHRTKQVISPPSAESLRRELRTALGEARKALKAVAEDSGQNLDRTKSTEGLESKLDSDSNPQQDPSSNDLEQAAPSSPKSQGWYEIQGIHILDVSTLAIRAARMYYTAHDQPQRLSAIKSERKIRQELLSVLDVLRRMASRNFAGGIKPDERLALEGWVISVENLLDQEEKMEEAEVKTREKWVWFDGDWTGREYEREWNFLRSFDTDPDPLPSWDLTLKSGDLPSPFLKSLQNGVRLVRLHNEIVRSSKRSFGEIKTFHTDTAKPYRCAENLRYWIKAAEIRWEIKLDVNVMQIVHGKGEEAWRNFEVAVWKWCRRLREEISEEHRQRVDAARSKTQSAPVEGSGWL
ncbi:MAG: hypothetical protein M1827_006056 [Pycnora praestabilis]|nr:MAG: hypothetical protein M1827_006056 [Pycnora praestabilis]